MCVHKGGIILIKINSIVKKATLAQAHPLHHHSLESVATCMLVPHHLNPLSRKVVTNGFTTV